MQELTLTRTSGGGFVQVTSTANAGRILLVHHAEYHGPTLKPRQSLDGWFMPDEVMGRVKAFLCDYDCKDEFCGGQRDGKPWFCDNCREVSAILAELETGGNHEPV